MFGDDDGGKLLKFEARGPADFRAALSNGAALFGRADYKFVAGDAAEETLWLLGVDGMVGFDRHRVQNPKKLQWRFLKAGITDARWLDDRCPTICFSTWAARNYELRPCSR